MEWKRSSPEVLAAFDSLVPGSEGVERRKMFGYPCAFLNGNMFMGVFQEQIFIRLSAEDRDAFLDLDGARGFEPVEGRIMREYVIVPDWMMERGDELRGWIERSEDYVSSLPSKRGRGVKTGKKG